MKTLYFSNYFIQWYNTNRRELPWRQNIQGYNIWIAEIIFQQTRIDQGLDYYNRFIERYPDIESLAASTEEEVLKMWQGLGYYSRARNLHATAKQVVCDYGGRFPATYSEIIKLKGIGSYTAAAIASIAFNEPVGAVDGNVVRVLSRLFALNQAFDNSKGKEYFRTLTEELMDPEHPGDYNQAVMEFGALVCTPRNPSCTECPLNTNCIAHATSTISLYPVKKKKQAIRNRYFYYLLIYDDNNIIVKKRIENDIWKNLYDFPLVELRENFPPESLEYSNELNKITGDRKFVIEKITREFTHKLSHQKIVARFIFIKADLNIKTKMNYLMVDKKDIFALPVPKIIEDVLKSEYSMKD